MPPSTEFIGPGKYKRALLERIFPGPLQCMEALTRTRLGINRVFVIDGHRCGSVRLSNERKSSKEPKSNIRQISNLTRVPKPIVGESRQPAEPCENPCGKFGLVVQKFNGAGRELPDPD